MKGVFSAPSRDAEGGFTTPPRLELFSTEFGSGTRHVHAHAPQGRQHSMPPPATVHCSPATQLAHVPPGRNRHKLLVQIRGPATLSRQAHMLPSVSVPQSAAATQTAHLVSTQRPLAQSLRLAQVLLMAQRGHVPPPQSTSVSAPFLTPSVQVGPDGVVAVATQVPLWHVPTLQAVPLSFALHLPFLQRFLPFFFSQSPLSHFAHSPHFGLHLPDLAAPASSGSARPSRPSDPARATANARRQDPAAVRVRVRLSKQSASMPRSSRVMREWRS